MILLLIFLSILVISIMVFIYTSTVTEEFVIIDKKFRLVEKKECGYHTLELEYYFIVKSTETKKVCKRTVSESMWQEYETGEIITLPKY